MPNKSEETRIRELEAEGLTRSDAQAVVEAEQQTAARYNWTSTGPGGCDAHCIEHPCGPCITGRRTA